MGVRPAVRRAVVRRAAPQIVMLLGRKNAPRKYVAQTRKLFRNIKRAYWRGLQCSRSLVRRCFKTE
eukprot:3526906-Pleurochrysis_carterae.AAC.1